MFVEKWTLHQALAWVMRRQDGWVASAKTSDYRPRLLRRGDYNPTGAEYDAWAALHAAITSGKIATASNYGSILLTAGDLHNFDWFAANGDPIGFRSLVDKTLIHSNIVVNAAQTRDVFKAADRPYCETSGELIIMSPMDQGDMSVSAAAIWIATKQNTEEMFLDDHERWSCAIRELLDRASSGEVQITGRKNGDEVSDDISPSRFVGLKIIAPYEINPSLAEIFKPQTRLTCGAFFGDEAGDCIEGERNSAPPFTHLHVRKSDIARLWPLRKEGDHKTAYSKKVGKKPSYDWDEVEEFLIGELNRRGDFEEPNQMEDWSRLADVERTVRNHMIWSAGGPAESTLRDRVSQIASKWRATTAGGRKAGN